MEPIAKSDLDGQGAETLAPSSLGQAQWTVIAKDRLSERLDPVSHGVCQGQVQAVMGNLIEFNRAAHLKSETTADQHEGNIVQSMRIPFAQFVGPDDQRVVEQGPGRSRFRSPG